jgi:hypothetical protein
MLPRALESATCVQRFDDSLNSAIRITYRISLRSSSLWEPRYPLLRVVYSVVRSNQSDFSQPIQFANSSSSTPPSGPCLLPLYQTEIQRTAFFDNGTKPSNANDPSAGSPTETLLRLLLPLVVQIYKSSNARRPLLTWRAPSRLFTGTTNR